MVLGGSTYQNNLCASKEREDLRVVESVILGPFSLCTFPSAICSWLGVLQRWLQKIKARSSLHSILCRSAYADLNEVHFVWPDTHVVFYSHETALLSLLFWQVTVPKFMFYNDFFPFRISRSKMRNNNFNGHKTSGSCIWCIWNEDISCPFISLIVFTSSLMILQKP